MRLLRTSLLLLCGCGRIGFGAALGDATASDGGGDGATDDADAPVDAAPPTGPFTGAATVMGLAGGGNDDPALTEDLLVIMFDSSRTGGAGGGDLWQATRTSTALPFSSITNQTALNTTGDDTTPWLSPDGLAMYYAGPGTVGQKDLQVVTRTTRTSAWSPPQQLSSISSTSDEAGPALTPDELAIYFASDRTGNDNIFFASRTSIGAAWSTPMQRMELSSTASDGEPWIDASQTTIVFASDRPGGAGGFDLYVARRTTSTLPFDPPMRITELATAGDETDPWLSTDQRTIYFARGNVIYSATR